MPPQNNDTLVPIQLEVSDQWLRENIGFNTQAQQATVQKTLNVMNDPAVRTALLQTIIESEDLKNAPKSKRERKDDRVQRSHPFDLDEALLKAVNAERGEQNLMPIKDFTVLPEDQKGSHSQHYDESRKALFDAVNNHLGQDPDLARLVVQQIDDDLKTRPDIKTQLVQEAHELRQQQWTERREGYEQDVHRYAELRLSQLTAEKMSREYELSGARTDNIRVDPQEVKSAANVATELFSNTDDLLAIQRMHYHTMEIANATKMNPVAVDYIVLDKRGTAYALVTREDGSNHVPIHQKFNDMAVEYVHTKEAVQKRIAEVIDEQNPTASKEQKEKDSSLVYEMILRHTQGGGVQDFLNHHIPEPPQQETQPAAPAAPKKENSMGALVPDDVRSMLSSVQQNESGATGPMVPGAASSRGLV